MTEKANPSANRPAGSFETAGAIALAGGAAGWISPSSSPSAISVQDTGIDDTALDAFSITFDSQSFSVDIAPGEAFIFGSWLAIDTVSSVTLSSSTSNQTVYVGWDRSSANEVIVGLDSAFATSSSDTDQRIPLFDVDTDGSGVTGVTDRREIGQYHEIARLQAERSGQFGYGLLVGQTLESDESLYIPSDNSMVVADKYDDQGDLQVDGVLKVI